MRQNTVLRLSAAMPRAIVGRVRAEQNATQMLAQINAAVTEFKERYDGRLDVVEQSLNEKIAAVAINGIGAISAAVEPEYTTAFASYTRSGAVEAEDTLRAANRLGDRAIVQAAMSVGDNSNGGYLAPVEWDRKVQKAQRAVSPFRRIAQVVTTSQSAYSTLWSDDAFGSGWVGETAARPATTTNTFTPLVIPSGEIYANPAVTQKLLDDSAINLEDWLATNLSDEFSRQEDIAFVSGDGVNKPMGFLRNVVGGTAENAHPGGALAQTLTGHATLLNSTDSLVDLKYGLGAPYRQNAVWLMNSQTAAVISKMKNTDGDYIWREALLASEPSTLLGRPVEIDENMPNIGAGTFPIAFGDFGRGYLVNDRLGTRILRDPYTNKPYVMFYATKRVGGAVLDPKAIRVMKVAAS